MSGMNCYDCHELEQELKLVLLHLDIANAAIAEYRRRLKDEPYAEVYGNHEWGIEECQHDWWQLKGDIASTCSNCGKVQLV